MSLARVFLLFLIPYAAGFAHALLPMDWIWLSPIVGFMAGFAFMAVVPDDAA